MNKKKKTNKKKSGRFGPRRATTTSSTNPGLVITKSSSSPFLLMRGNIGLARCLVAVRDAGPNGISTRKLLYRLGSTKHGQSFIKRAEREGYIKRVPEEPPSPDEFPAPRYNVITQKGLQLLKNQLK